MLSYLALANKPRVFQSLSGLKVEEFQPLLQPFSKLGLPMCINTPSKAKLGKDGTGQNAKANWTRLKTNSC
jgi:hypothetical protein